MLSVVCLLWSDTVFIDQWERQSCSEAFLLPVCQTASKATQHWRNTSAKNTSWAKPDLRGKICLTVSLGMSNKGWSRLRAHYTPRVYTDAFANMLLQNASLGSVYASSACCCGVDGLLVNCPNTLAWRAGSGSHISGDRNKNRQTGCRATSLSRKLWAAG